MLWTLDRGGGGEIERVQQGAPRFGLLLLGWSAVRKGRRRPTRVELSRFVHVKTTQFGQIGTARRELVRRGGVMCLRNYRLQMHHVWQKLAALRPSA